MRIDEILVSVPLVETMMSYPNWLKKKDGRFYYSEPFLEGILSGQPYAFLVGKDKFNGIIQDPINLKRQMMSALAGNIEFKDIIFSVEMLNDDDEPTGEIVDYVKLNQIYKDEKIKGELKPNMGNITEALLGCAVAAKFINGGKQITQKQLVEMGRQLARNKGYIETTAGKDKLMFKVTIPFLDKKAFYAWLNEDSRNKTLQDYNVPEASIALIERRATLAVEYANTSKRVLSAVQQAQRDPSRNTVDVISDGGESANQSITKVDLKILIDGKETAKRLLSIKAGNVAQFGQIGGANFEHASNFFKDLGVTIPDSLRKQFYNIPAGTRGAVEEKKHNFENGNLKVYQNAAKQFKAKSQTDQAGLVEDVYQGLLQHLTRKEKDVEMVILDPDDKKAFRELSFGDNFERAMRQLQIRVVDNYTENSHVISIYGYPIGTIAKRFVPSGRKDASNKLVELRSQFKDGTIRNMLAMGGLLKDIADIENHIEKQSDSSTVSAELDSLKKNAGIPSQNPTTPSTARQSTSTDKMENLGIALVNAVANPILALKTLK